MALAFGASLSWGSGDFVGGLKSRRLPLLTVLLTSQVAALSVIAATFLIAGAGIGGSAFVIYAAAAGAVQILGLAAYYRALSFGAMGVAAPITATGVLIPLAVGLASGERLSALETLGVLCAVGGVLLVSYQPRHAPGRGSTVAIGVGMALLGGLGFGAFYVLMEEASSRGEIVSAVLVNRIAVFAILATGALVLGIRPSSLSGGDWRDVTLVGVLAVGATLLFATATTKGLLSLVSVLASLYPVVTILLARFVLGERVRRSQQLGAAAALAGVGMITA
jgi:drug/metabolite transporter (DMT)-like permease